MKNKTIVLKNGLRFKILDKIIKDKNTHYLVLNIEDKKIDIISPIYILAVGLDVNYAERI